jgi:nucleotide-binding universal stress UspA family protein
MIKNVLTFVDGSAPSLSWLDRAVDFCRQHDARLHVTLLMERLPLDVRDGYTLEDALDDDFAPLGDDAADIMFPPRLATSGVAVEISRIWRLFSDLPIKAAQQARLMDVVLVSPVSAWSDYLLRRRVIESVVTDAGTPTMIVPDSWSPARIGTLVLGWNGSSQAARAARALVALAEQGARVDVLVVKNGEGLEGEQSCVEITDHLASQGFKVEADVRLPDGRDGAEVLQTFAVSHNAQLLVVGGYSRAPWTEKLFGGVTRELIAEPELPVLMVG